MRYRTKVWVTDEREGDDRNNSGRRKIPRDIVTESTDPLDAVNAIQKALDGQAKGKRGKVERIQIEVEEPETAEGPEGFSLD